MAPNTLLVGPPGGSLTDLRSLSYFHVHKMELDAPGKRQGDFEPIPGAPGVVAVPLPLAAYTFSVYGRVDGSTREAFNANLAALGAIVAGSDGVLALTRRMASVGGPGYTESTAIGAFITGLDADRLNYLTGTVQLQFWNTSGGWIPSGGGAPSFP